MRARVRDCGAKIHAKMLGNVGGDDGDMHADILNVAVAVILLVVTTVVLMVTD